GPVETLCAMINNWDISEQMQVPEEVIQFLSQQGFFSLIIPKKYGGKEFSALGHSQVIIKISSVSTAVATVVAVPNSLGPAELLLHYGTETQKDYYLPRLAKGEEIPCFALTSPLAGSDAGGISDHGVVCEAEFDGKKQLCIRLNFNKRYITLAPIATLIGLAFKLYDPEHLLGEELECGITCALIPTDTAGVEAGRRHYPLHSAFPNGPVKGEDVLIPLEWVIGGCEQVGHGWRMLMECLAAGRGISLPSMTGGAAKFNALASGAYARIRRQFNTYIGQFGGIQEVLASMLANAYMLDALRVFTASNLDRGEKSAVAAAITKCHATELARQVGVAAMDVHGGKGICMGPNNYLAQAYFEIPIGITVEGANILTRSMMIFGQGAIRCHPFILTEMQAAADPDKAAGLKTFSEIFLKHMAAMTTNKARAFVLAITDGYFSKAPMGPLRRYYQQFTRFSAALAFATDIALVTLGGGLKRSEELSARLGDILSLLYIGSAVLRYYQAGDGGDTITEELPIVEYCCQTLCYRMELALDNFISNLPNRFIAMSLRMVVMPRGRHLRLPKDKIARQVARLGMVPNRFRKHLAHSMYQQREHSMLAKLEYVLAKAITIEPIEAKIVKAKREAKIVGKTLMELITAAEQAEIISQTEAKALTEFDVLRMEIIDVDDFDPSYFSA
ncbi:MAG: acyl-CoA dehydrogenase, partial [Gammaproteobacteria bacterium]|nr:acyl-CoA dehydrogenase [Gammaproteobacteria bacterium]